MAGKEAKIITLDESRHMAKDHQILVPASVANDRAKEVKTPARKAPPRCPACKAKFSHDFRAMACKRCGLPDEIRDMGGRMVARWKKQQGIKKPVGASAKKKRIKHGRMHS